MADVFNFLKAKADLSRNAFDLSQRHIFSAKAGLIQPVMCIDCVPGDYHEIDLSVLTRTMPVKTDAFARMKQEFTFVYVPYQQMWHSWNDFILQNTESFSDTVSNSRTLSTCPMVWLTPILNTIATLIYEELTKTTISGYPDIYDMFGYNRGQFALRMLDMLGYGSYYWIYDTLVDRVGYPDIATAYDVVKNTINAHFGDVISSSDENIVKVNPWRILAYQKACTDYFRNQYYTASNPYLFNVDSYDSQQDLRRTTDQVIEALLTPWYRMYKKDMFTGLMPSPQFGAVSSVSLDSIKIVNDNPTPLNNNAQVGGNNGILYISGQSARNQWTVNNAFDVYQLRKAECMQKWKEDRLRAGNKNRNISNVIYGTESRYLTDNYSDFVKSFDGNMSIDEVVNMSAQGSAELGELGGKSVGVVGGKLTYKTQEFGVLICLYSVVPVQEYDAVGLDKNNTLVEPFDYFEPHFENLGFDGVYKYQLNVSATSNTPLGLRKTLGYAPRFLNYKTAIDKVHGEFMSVGFGSNVNLPADSGTLSHWTTPRSDLEAAYVSDNGIQPQFFYVNPKVVDPIFVTQATSMQDSDNFLVNANFVINSVRNMSVLGLPRW